VADVALSVYNMQVVYLLGLGTFLCWMAKRDAVDVGEMCVAQLSKETISID